MIHYRLYLALLIAVILLIIPDEGVDGLICYKHPQFATRTLKRQSEARLNISGLFAKTINDLDAENSNCIWRLKRVKYRCEQVVSRQWQKSVANLKLHPYQYITIPLVAALVGYITNWLGVSMLFYPIEWKGIPLRRWKDQPFGLLGWQGVVPAKRMQMAGTMVDVTINRLLKIKDVFSLLNPSTLASIMQPCLSKLLYGGLVPGPAMQYYLTKVAKDLITNIEKIVDIRSLVVTGMTSDPKILGSFFQRVGAKELRFLVESGTYFGFALGLAQMLQWMIYPANWTLPVSGAIVGYVTNWIALKWIFEPLYPTRVGPFILQGLFLRRQKEVSAEFCGYITDNILNSKEVWKMILQGKGLEELKAIIASNIPFLSSTDIVKVVTKLKDELILSATAASHPLHAYTNSKLNLKWTLTKKMNLLSPAQFEQVLHPIFQEDELTLIVAGGVLGMAAGFVQWWVNEELAKRQQKKKERMALIVQPEIQVTTLPVIVVEPSSDKEVNT